TRCRLVGLAGSDADCRQADADAVENLPARIVADKQFRDRLLGPVTGQWSGEELVADRLGEGRAKDRDRRRENESRPIRRLRSLTAERVAEIARPVEVDTIPVVDTRLGLARDDRRKMEYEVRPRGNATVEGGRVGNVEGRHRQAAAEALGFLRLRNIDKRKRCNFSTGELPVARQPLREL